MKIGSLAKFVDQTHLVSKLHQYMPAVLVGGAAVYGTVNTMKQPKEERKKAGIKNAIILAATVGASLLCCNGLKIGKKQIFNGSSDVKKLGEAISDKQGAIKEFFENSDIKDNKVTDILTKAKNKIIKPKDVDYLVNNIPESSSKTKLFTGLFGENKELSWKDTLGEIKRLSILGFVPVVGGVAGGIVADKVTGDSHPHKTANKVKEGAYQYLANIFLCNVGAGLGLLGLEKLNKKGIIKNVTPALKMSTILTGIMATGVIGGSYIANFLCKHLIDPIFDKKAGKTKDKNKHGDKSLYAERKPEPLDLAMHVDDIATAGVLAGLKWIEPALPIMYSLSGYRAGIGYRNNEDGGHSHGHHHGHHGHHRKHIDKHNEQDKTKYMPHSHIKGDETTNKHLENHQYYLLNFTSTDNGVFNLEKKRVVV